MYDPLAVGVAIDSTLVKAPAMHVDVETRGEFTRGGNRGEPARSQRAKCAGTIFRMATVT